METVLLTTQNISEYICDANSNCSRAGADPEVIVWGVLLSSFLQSVPVQNSKETKTSKEGAGNPSFRRCWG